MGAAIVVLFFLPWIDRNEVRSVRYRSTAFKLNLAMFAITFVVLAYLGMSPAEPILVIVAQIFTALYFLFFIFLYLISKTEKTRPVPERVTWK